MHTHIRKAVTRAILALGLLMVVGYGGAAGQPPPGTYIYTFTNHCAQTIFIGQNGPGTSSTPPVGGNWALGPACTSNGQCGASQTCSKGAGQSRGQCTCTSNSDCPGSAPCTSGLCKTVAVFNMPQAWSSGVFWPRTGCVLSNGELNCSTGQCGGDPTALTGGRLDCGSASGPNGQNGPTPPITLFEPTTTATNANYDVSLNNGYNVEMKVTAAGGSGSLCTYAGCLADLNTAGHGDTSCPSNLVFKDPRGGSSGGCYQPQDACLSSGAGSEVTPPAGLSCTSTITTDALGNAPVSTTNCSGITGGSVTYLDMYEARNTADSVTNTQATANGGTPTAFSQADCLPGTEFTSTFVASGSCSTSADCKSGQTCKAGTCAVVPPPGMGVCLQFTSGILVPNWGCSATNIGAACGQYNGSRTNALGYTCQAATYSGGTAYPCVPSTLSGLGVCNTQGEGFYPGVGGVFNPSWVQAGIQAGGGKTPYYQTFKNACPAAYTWQYDDVSGGRSCTLSGQTSQGFNIDFCASLEAPPTLPRAPGQIRAGTAIQVGVAPAPDGSGRGSLSLTGMFTFEGRINLAASGARATIVNGLNERGSELLLGGPLTLPAEGRNTATTARFKTPPGQTPVAGVTIGSRGRGQYTLLMDVSRTTIDVPGVCPQPELTTTIRVEDGTNPPLLIAIEQPWQCRTRGNKVEYLRTP